MEAGPAWHPRTAVSRRQRLGLEPRRGGAIDYATGRRAATAGRDHPPAAKSGRYRDFKLSENVQAAGAWREQIEKEKMPVVDLLACVARCRVGERSATRQPRPWSQYMPDTSGTWGMDASSSFSLSSLPACLPACLPASLPPSLPPYLPPSLTPSLPLGVCVGGSFCPSVCVPFSLSLCLELYAWIDDVLVRCWQATSRRRTKMTRYELRRHPQSLRACTE